MINKKIEDVKRNILYFFITLEFLLANQKRFVATVVHSEAVIPSGFHQENREVCS